LAEIVDEIFDQNENLVLVSLISAENYEGKYTRISFSFRLKISSAISAKNEKILHTRIDKVFFFFDFRLAPLRRRSDEQVVGHGHQLDASFKSGQGKRPRH
jgi:hypothetical protein